jgi:hypothetical protein
MIVAKRKAPKKIIAMAAARNGLDERLGPCKIEPETGDNSVTAVNRKPSGKSLLRTIIICKRLSYRGMSTALTKGMQLVKWHPMEKIALWPTRFTSQMGNLG